MNEGVQFQLNEIFQNGRKISDFSYFSDVCTSWSNGENFINTSGVTM